MADAPSQTEILTVLPVDKDFLMPPGNNGQQRRNYHTLALMVPHGSVLTDSTQEKSAIPASQRAAVPPPYDPQEKISPQDYSAFVETLNKKINESSAAGNALVVDLSKYPETEDILKLSHDFLAAKPDATREELRNLIRGEREHILAARVISIATPNWDTNHVDTFSLAMPHGPQETSSSMFSLSEPFSLKIKNDKWDAPGTSFAHHWGAAHEAHHAMAYGRQNSNAGLYPQRYEETSADVFSILYLAQQNEPDLDRQLQSLIQFRDAANIFKEDVEHNSGDALRQLARDLPKLRADPNFHMASLDTLSTLASQYAQQSLFKDYPHLKNNKITDYDAALKTTGDVDAKLKIVAQYAHDAYYFDSYPESIKNQRIHKPENLDTRQAALLLRASEAITAITGDENHGVAKATKEMRARFPQAFKEADQELGLTPQTQHLNGQKHSRTMPSTMGDKTYSTNKPAFISPNSPG